MRFPESILDDEAVADLQKEPGAVLKQVVAGRLSLELARWRFGVVFRGELGGQVFEVDDEATKRQRAEILMAGAPPGGA